MGKQILAVVVGAVMGFVVLGLIEMVSWMLYPMPEGLDIANAEVMRAYVSQVPIGAKLIVLVAWMIGAFVAGFLAAKIAPEGKGRQSAIFAGAILMLGGIANAFMVPHPMWMLIIGLLQYIPLAHIGAKAAGK